MKKNSFILYAKSSGLTSFSSLHTIKNALNTSKVGHTGTLDNFADGLLIVMVNKLTKLVSHVTNLDKKYECIIRFGSETDTLDYTGSVIQEAALPTQEKFFAAINHFVGKISQIPPLYSAIRVNGKRASDLTRKGIIPEMATRNIEIFSLKVLAFTPEYAHIFIHCSKGTYIRSLARDIAYECNSCGHLVALRRLAVGPFDLKDSIGFENLPTFNIKNLQTMQEYRPTFNKDEMIQKIMTGQRDFSIEIAKCCNFNTIILQKKYKNDFFAGRPLQDSFFTNKCMITGNDFFVFLAEENIFCGSIKINENNISYNFVY
ncbi:MAG: tRNA pseudouridine(55) synthase TruB [Treponemataceae bacterium]